MYIYRGTFSYDTYADNNQFTLIFPNTIDIAQPVFAGWQWTTEPDSNESNVIVSDWRLIDRINKSLDNRLDGIITFGFFHNSYDTYQFDVTPQNLFKDLVVTMSNPKDEKSSTFTLNRVYDKASTAYALPTPRVFVGEISYSTYLDHKMIIVVTPGILKDGVDICAYWQWSVAPDKKRSSNLNEDIVKPISDSKLSDTGRTFSFDTEGTYRFKCTLDEDKDTLKLVLNDDNDNASTLTEERNQTSNSTMMRLSTTTINNDTDDVVFCSLQPSGSPMTDTIIAGAGWLLGGAGLTALHATESYAYQSVADNVRFGSSVTGAPKVFCSSGEEVCDLLFPNDIVARRPKAWGYPRNVLRVSRIRCVGRDRLLMEAFEETRVGNGTVTIKSIGQMEQTVNLLFDLPQYQDFYAHRCLFIPNIQVSSSFSPPHQSSWKLKRMEGSVWSIGGGATRWCGNIYPTNLKDGEELFGYHDRNSTGVFQAKSSTDNYEVLCRSDHTLILKLKHCRLSSSDSEAETKSKFMLKACYSDDKAKQYMDKGNPYWAYTLDQNRLYGVEKSLSWKIVYSEKESSVYLVASHWTPYLGVVP